MTEYLIDANRFKEITGVKLYRDGLISALIGGIAVDVVAVDKSMSKLYNYEGSLNIFILEKFGNEALEILNKWS